jgi:hypothetical protein
MKKYIKYLLFMMLGAFICQSCELIADAVSDDTSTSKVVNISNSITQLSFKSDMEIELIESNENSITFSGAEALLNKLTVKKDTSTLTITYNKFASWSYAVPKAEIRMTSICKINLYAYNELYASDTLRSSNINIYSDGTGDINLSVNCDTLNVFGNNISNFYIDGKTDCLYITTTFGSAFYGSDLIANNVETNIKGSNNQIVYPVDSLTCNIDYTGNVYYVNQPDVLIENISDDASGSAIYNSNKK